MSRLALATAPRRHDRREAILAAAAEVWNAQGARGFTVAAVARRVGLHPVSVTHYFRTRDDLAAECMLETIARVTVMARDASLKPTPRERVAAYVRAYFEIRRRVAEGLEGPLASFSEIRRVGPSPDSPVIEAFRGYLRVMLGLFSLEPGVIDRRNGVLYARLLIEHLGWSRGWIDLYEPAEYAGIAERMTDIILNGLAAPGQPWLTSEPLALGSAAASHRDRFLIAATTLINQHGYNGASIDEIAASLNVTKGSFYHHLQDKEELLQACFERSFAIAREALSRTAGEPRGWPRLEAIVISLVLHQARGLHGPMLRTQTLAAVSPESRPAVVLQYRDLAYRLAAIVSAGIADGSVRPVDPFLAAQVMIGAINSSLDLDHWMRDASAVDILQDFARPALTGLPI